tara:strand:- start:1182 stop:1679 length:498 start_codon:yes stop_codon:yes gene_type:complete
MRIKTLPKYQTHDIVLARSGHVFIITGYKASRPKYPYVGKAFHGQQKTFKLGDDNIVEKIGTADPDCNFLNGGNGAGGDEAEGKPAHFEQGQNHAKYMAQYGPEHDRPKWKLLASLDFGDEFILLREGAVVYQGVKQSRPKYPVSYLARGGKGFKCAISMVNDPN